MGALFLPEIDDGSHDGGDIRDATASDTDSDARSRLEPAGESGCAQLAMQVGGDVGDGAVWKMLLNTNKPRELHAYRINPSGRGAGTGALGGGTRSA
jgi:hypothetical protein